jgi:hypothetical protein
MNVRVHIDRVVLEGLPISSRRAIHLAVERELATLLAYRVTWPTAGISVPRVSGPVLSFARSQPESRLGASVARSVEGAIGRGIAP